MSRRNDKRRSSSSIDKALRRELKEIESLISDNEILMNTPPFAIAEIPEIRREEVASADITEGKEKYPIRAVNGVDDDPAPADFTYITEAIYTPSIEMIGCGCLHGCSDSKECSCVAANKGGRMPFNKDGRIRKYLKDGVHECGPACKCPADCKNRVGQSGPRGHFLEIFKTEEKGWGLRSQDRIPKGGFICEYIGDVLRAGDGRVIGENEYVFDVGGGFVVDASKNGNVGRFVNHGCSPNAFAQHVFYCNRGEEEERMPPPRIMFFASEKIAPLKEIVVDYNYYNKGSVGKEKACHCGSPECRERFY